MEKLYLKIFALMIIYLIIFYPLQLWVDKHQKGNFDLCDKQEWVLSKQGESFQDGFIGSSRAFNMLDMNILSKELGRKTINLATSGSNFSENLLLLHLFLQNGNQLERVFIQADVYGLDSKNSYSYPFHDYVYLPYLGDSLVDQLYKREVPSYKYLMWRYIPFLKYMEFNDRYSFYKMIRGGYNCTESEFDGALGSEIHTDNGFEENEEARLKFGVNATDVKSLVDLIDYCKQNGIEVVLYQAPEYVDYVKRQKNRSEVLEEYQAILKGEKLKWLDFVGEDSLNTNKLYFKDNTHLNQSGVEAMSKSLAVKIKQMDNPD
ncbi:MAG: hypothetical protein MRZ79_19295 [Bacteroidia bacterium]|nr:hypothetical protein [Bacteroidia bacterium]